MRTQADDLRAEKNNLLGIMSQIEKMGAKHTEMYKYYENRYYKVVSTIENIR
jgi:hypothetical protein